MAVEAVWINLSQRCKKIVEKLSETAYKRPVVDKMWITFLFCAFNQQRCTHKCGTNVENSALIHSAVCITP